MQAEVYLPKGDWYRLSTGQLFNGGQTVEADAPLTDLPVFVKAGAIIPMQDTIQSTNDNGDGVLELHIWHGIEPSQFVYYEDDGMSYDYQNGSYYKRTISFDPAQSVLTLSAIEGDFTSKYATIRLSLHGLEENKANNKTYKNTPNRLTISC